VLSLIAHRAFGFSITAKKGSRKTKQEETKKKKVTRRWPLMSKPVDDVYLTWYYERPSYDVEEALGMLKKFQELDFTNPKQYVYINVFLDMALQKKKKVDPFASIVLLPYRFTDEVNKVLVFTEVAEIARENGAAVVGGVELIKWILEDEIQVDFYVAVPAIMPKLIPLRSKLKRKYPNSMGHDIPKMLKLFREGLEYMVEGDKWNSYSLLCDIFSWREHCIPDAKTLRMPRVGSVFAATLARNCNNEQNRMRKVSLPSDLLVS
uniref:Mitochondrial ribosomal protein L1 n=1 Tax=Buteo japonicus TaxID=224669 RepID=A0A8C0BH41_9AVES